MIIANNTRFKTTDAGFIITLHNTDVVQFINGIYILNSGGWHTTTTKNRINSILPSGRIVQKNYKWYYENDGKLIPFYDRMQIINGKVIGE